MDYPIERWLFEMLEKFKCAPVLGTKYYDGQTLQGWYLPTSRDKIFMVRGNDRGKIGAKYLSPPKKGLQPALFMLRRGLITLPGPTEEILPQLRKEGLALTEGWKGAAALWAAGFNSCTIGGCNGGVATLKILKEHGIPADCVTRIFADTDILTAPQVAKGYRELSQEFKTKPEIWIHPPQHFISDTGEINLSEKYAPDDFISEGDDVDIVLKNKVVLVQLDSIEQFHKKIASVVAISQEVHVKRGAPNIAAMEWLEDLLTERTMYLSETSQYYYYTQENYWEVFDARTLLDQVLATTPCRRFTYSILENALKLVAPKLLKTEKEINTLFSSQRFLGFQNGVWDMEQKKLLEPRSDQYLSGLLPFNKITLTHPTQSLKNLCPNICSWLIDRANGQEVYANILLAFIFLTIRRVKNPQRFLFLSGYSASGKSTYILLVSAFVMHNMLYSGRSEVISGNFGLQDFTGLSKTLVTFHDLGARVSDSFVNLIRNLVSTGESQTVTRKFQKTARMCFEGILIAASNKNPFTSQQREGIVDRRMIYVPFVNRVSSQRVRDFKELFPLHELERLAAFALEQDIRLVLKFVQNINQHPIVQQNMLESFKENPISQHLQNFISTSIFFSEGFWVPLGSSEDENMTEGSLYCAYLRYLHEQGVSKLETLKYAAFRQEFLPMINTLYPTWEVVERRRLTYIYGNKRVAGLLNINVSKQPRERKEPAMDLSEFRAAPFWLSVVDERPFSDQNADGRSGVDESERPSSDQNTDGRSGVDESWEGGLGAVIKYINQTYPLSFWHREDILQVQTTLSQVLKYRSNPRILIEPTPADLSKLFAENPVIMLDTEFSVETILIERQLAYIQLYFVENNTICILTYKSNFMGFREVFFDWLEKENSIVVGFFLLADLTTLWRHFMPSIPFSRLTYSFFDLYLFFRLVHNGYPRANSLKDWANRLLGKSLDKTSQKTDWFETPLSSIQNYLVQDVEILQPLLNYVQDLASQEYCNTWKWEFYKYFEISYTLDQRLLPCFLEMSLKGVSISGKTLCQTIEECRKQTGPLLKSLGLTEEEYNSTKQFTSFLLSTSQPIGKVTSLWPTTAKSSPENLQYSRSRKQIRAMLSKEQTHPLFQQKDILQWLGTYFELNEVQSLLSSLKTLLTRVKENKTYPSWDIAGGVTGRILTREPNIHGTPRNLEARSHVVPSRPNYKFVIADYKTIELVINAISFLFEISLFCNSRLDSLSSLGLNRQFVLGSVIDCRLVSFWLSP